MSPSPSRVPWGDLVVAHDGARIAVRDTGADLPALLCIHGNSQSLASWGLLAASLHDRFRVVALDLRGHGLTTAGPGRSWTRYADDVAAVAGHLELERPVLVGHSLGARVAQVAAAQGFDAGGIVAIDSGWGPEPDPAFDTFTQAEEDQRLAQDDPDAFRRRAAPLLERATSDDQFEEAVEATIDGLQRVAPDLPEVVVRNAAREFMERMHVHRDGAWFLRFDLDEALAQALGLADDMPRPDDVFRDLHDRIVCPQLLVLGNGDGNRWTAPAALRRVLAVLEEHHGVEHAWLPTGHNVHLERPDLFTDLLTKQLAAWGHR